MGILELLISLEEAGVSDVIADNERVLIFYLLAPPPEDLLREAFALKPRLLAQLRKTCQIDFYNPVGKVIAL